MLLPGITAPFGATILGVVSISQIRHSAGRLYGLGLALFDALLFPLLLLDWVIIMLPASVIWFFLNVKTAGGAPPTLPADSIKVGVLLFFVFMIALRLRIDYLIVRWAWREANRPVGAHLPERATGYASASPPDDAQRPDTSPPSIGGASGTRGTPGPDALEQARRQVHGPAIGLLITGILNIVVFVGLIVLAAIYLHLSFR